MIALDVLGWAGALALLLAYALLTAAGVQARSPAYRTLNLAGSAALAVNGAAHGAWPSAALNLLWLAIGAHALRTAKPVPRPPLAPTPHMTARIADRLPAPQPGPPGTG